MSRHTKAFLILSGIQIACLGCGLWIQDRLVVAMHEWSLKQDASATDESASNAPQSQVKPAEMSTIKLLSLFWIGGLQAVSAGIVLTYLKNGASESQQRTRMQLARREKELVRTRNAVIFGLAKLAEYRDRETGQHLERIALYSTTLATAMRRDPRFRNRVSAQFVKSIGISSVLHDIGKVAIADAVLRKPGKLNDDERKLIEQHTLLGGQCIRQIEQRLGNCNFLQVAREITFHHHERWDGAGYPDGLAGEEIPLGARLVAVADVYDALASKRVYKDALPHSKCCDIIREEAGKHLDPAIVDVFLQVENQFREVAARFADRDEVESSEALTTRTSARAMSESTKEETNLINQLLETGDESAQLTVSS